MTNGLALRWVTSSAARQADQRRGVVAHVVGDRQQLEGGERAQDDVDLVALDHLLRLGLGAGRVAAGVGDQQLDLAAGERVVLLLQERGDALLHLDAALVGGPVLTVKRPILKGAALSPGDRHPQRATALAPLANIPASTVLRLMVMACTPLLVVYRVVFLNAEAHIVKRRGALGKAVLGKAVLGKEVLGKEVLGKSLRSQRTCPVVGRRTPSAFILRSGSGLARAGNGGQAAGAPTPGQRSQSALDPIRPWPVNAPSSPCPARTQRASWADTRPRQP